jgi:predicted RNase H-like HicB family nuclease
MDKPKLEDYAIEIRPLTEEEGGGFLATFPDLPGGIDRREGCI